jgi:hypothetical protein
LDDDLRRLRFLVLVQGKLFSPSPISVLKLRQHSRDFKPQDTSPEVFFRAGIKASSERIGGYGGWIMEAK